MKKNRFTLTKKEEKYVCRYTLESSDIVDTKAFDAGLSGKLPQIIPCNLEEKDGEREFVYDVGDKLLLAEYLKKEVNKKQMLMLLYNILSTLEKFGQNMISISYVAKDVQYIFVDAETLETYFLVAAVSKEASDLNEVKSLIKDIISGARYFEMDKDNYVAKLITFVNRQATFSIVDTKDFVDRMLTNMGVHAEEEKSTVNAPSQNKVSRVAVMQNNAKLNQATQPQGGPMPMQMGPDGRPVPMQGRPMPPQGGPMPMQMGPDGRPVPMQGGPMPMQGQPMPMQMGPDGRPVPMQGRPMPPQGQPMPMQMGPDGRPVPMQGRPIPPQGQPIPPQGQPIPPQGQPMPPQGQPMPPQMKSGEKPIPPVPVNQEAKSEKEAVPEAPKTETAATEASTTEEPQETPITEEPQQEQPQEAQPMPYLLRVKTNEKIYIDKSEFVIGKSATKADYTIDDNTAVSRLHCIITRKNGVSYIKDNRSTNGTFVNGKDIAEKENVFLTNNARVSLGDEEFIYFVK